MPDLFPLQTRAAWLTPDRLESEDRLRRAVETSLEKSYNTLILPAMYAGTAYFRARASGELKEGYCHGVEALKILAEYDVTIWLGIDPLAAGVKGTGKLSRLADRNRHWLMRSVRGEFPPPQTPEIPGIFDWTSLAYRDFLGTMMVELLDGYPIDGVVLDLRLIPPTTEEPETWTHFGFASLSRIQQELNLDVEKFLVRPTTARHKRIVDWRYRELRIFLKNLKARAQRCRDNIPFYFQVALENLDTPFAPWAKWDKGQLAESFILHAPAEELADYAAVFDRLFKIQRPYLVAIDAETDLGDLSKTLPKTPANGFCVLHPGPLERVVMPTASWEWSFFGAVEEHPVAAALEIIDKVAPEFTDCQFMRPFFAKLSEYLTNAGERLSYEIALNIRTDLLDMKKNIAAGSIDIDGDRDTTSNMLDFIARLLLLVDVPPVEY